MGRIRGRWSRCRGSLGLAPEELLLAKPESALEPFVLDFELGLALKAPAVHGFPVGGLTKRLELLL